MSSVSCSMASGLFYFRMQKQKDDLRQMSNLWRNIFDKESVLLHCELVFQIYNEVFNQTLFLYITMDNIQTNEQLKKCSVQGIASKWTWKI